MSEQHSVVGAEAGWDEAVSAALAGDGSYDTLDGARQVLVRAVWERQIVEARESLNLAEEFRAAGISGWVEADADGRTVFRS